MSSVRTWSGRILSNEYALSFCRKNAWRAFSARHTAEGHEQGA